MLKYILYLAGTLLLLLPVQSGHAQSNQFRDTRAHLAIGVGAFTYYGPLNLLIPEGSNNYIRETDPAVVLLGSFPIVGDHFYFRGMIGMTNFEQDKGISLSPLGQNEFLINELFFFEPQVVYTLLPGSKSRFLPYVYTGFGSLVADPFRRDHTSNVNVPGTGIPGPERSVFTLALGVGCDVAFTGCFSIFVDASYRFDLNYVWRNEILGVNPHDTSLIMGGIRIGLGCGRRRTPLPDRVGPIPEPMDIPVYEPPEPVEVIPTMRCVLVELNTVYFEYDSIVLDADARSALDDNIEAMGFNPACCVEIVGYTDRTDDMAYSLRIARQRAEVVYQYYRSRGIDQNRMTVRAEGYALPCDKEDEGPGCRRNRRVESIPFECDSYIY